MAEEIRMVKIKWTVSGEFIVKANEYSIFRDREFIAQHEVSEIALVERADLNAFGLMDRLESFVEDSENPKIVIEVEPA